MPIFLGIADNQENNYHVEKERISLLELTGYEVCEMVMVKAEVYSRDGKHIDLNHFMIIQ